ncbi:dihydropteroate synthase [Knoellia flava TL1]|uniref:Dihydropteroate synthase n=2 Tax=Knoellia flava TaxID=913969 RepID=A0A8H9FSH7_9MICO|nr:dihydropteroate synthase [Knoellia flava]KGN29562.1 dihydropteroate synthase [Knoellia flava TL1]GGB75399.1 dihydropteroate synthase [Knoellia flava]
MIPLVAGPRPLVMGVVNVTPDSFSDGGEWFEPEAAIAHGRELIAAGADLIDVGGESTRPGAERPAVEEELRRVVPVVRALAAEGAVISIDTMRACVAGAAVEAGAAIVNDVSAGLADGDMAALVAQAGIPFIAMHWRGHSTDMQSRAVYDDVVDDVCRELRQRVEALQESGIRAEDIILDPGFGFAKTAAHNWALLNRLDEVVALGHPVLVGASRKTFLGRVGQPPGADPRPPAERDLSTAVTSFHAARCGAWAVRVHDVASTTEALDVADALRTSGTEEGA